MSINYLLPVAFFTLFTAWPVASQPLEISTLEAKNAPDTTFVSEAMEPRYITDVSGKKVRLVGPRFYPDSARMLEFPGRSSRPNLSQPEGRLSQR